jgi:hypothetical protein
MDKNGKLSEKEAALIAAAKRDLAAVRQPGAAAPAGVKPPAGLNPEPAAKVVAPSPAPPVSTADAASARAERMARLMADEAAEHRRRHKKLQLYLVVIPLALLIAGFLWVLLTTLPRLR